MFKRLRILLVIALLLLAPGFAYAAESDIEAEKQRMLEVFDYIINMQVSNPEAGSVADNAIKGMLENLPDPYNTYFTQAEYEEFMEGLSGTFSGVGMYLEEKDGYVVVQAPIEGSPAYNAGLKPGDRIIGVNGEDVATKAMETVISKIRGPSGTDVAVTIIRNESGLDVEKTFVVTRQVIQLPLVESKMLDGQIGYIKLFSFSEQSEIQFRADLDKLQKQEMKGFILDLRDNPGGVLDSAVSIASIFVGEGKILQVKDKNGSADSHFAFGGEKWTLPTVTLINENSASASEILAGALKDYKIGTILGQKSFGKGSVQGLFDLDAPGVLKLTIQEYFSPNNNKINGIGITPDVTVDQFPLQLETAKRLLGVYSTIRLESGGLVFLDGTKYDGEKPIAIRQNGEWFVAIRAIQNLYGGELTWNPEQRYSFYKLRDNQQFIKAGINSNAFLQNGQTYVSLNRLLTTFANDFTWDGTTLKFNP